MMKKFFLIKYNRLIVVLLTFLGIGGACTFNGCMYGAEPCEYGTPTALFKVHGTIASEDNAKIPYFRVTMQGDTVFSDSEGAYAIDVYDFPDDQEFEIRFTDMDGAEHGSWQEKDTTVVFTDPVFKKGDGSWYAGETSKELNIRLKPGEQ